MNCSRVSVRSSRQPPHALLRLEDEARPPRRLNDRIPRDLETICLKAMAKTAGRRIRRRRTWLMTRRFLRNEPVKARPAGRAERV